VCGNELRGGEFAFSGGVCEHIGGGAVIAHARGRYV
jgi:hypothetical protein